MEFFGDVVYVKIELCLKRHDVILVHLKVYIRPFDLRPSV